MLHDERRSPDGGGDGRATPDVLNATELDT